MSQQDYLDAMRSIFASDQEMQDFLDCMQKPLKKTIKMLASRMDIPTFIQKTSERGRHLAPTQFHTFTDMFYIDRDDTSTPLGKTFLHMLGFLYMQEAAASIPPHLLDIPDNGIVLDMCASPGGKTIQMADYALADGKNTIIIANEFNGKRIPALGSNLTRTGMYNTAITKYNGAVFGTQYPELFDAVLLDAPCSGEGTGFKSDAAYKRRKLKEIEKIARTQEMLLVSAVKTCKPGGIIIYSTCTLNPIENEKNIQNILQKYPDMLELEYMVVPGTEKGVTVFQDKEIIDPAIAKHCIRCRPHKQGTGGFFVARFRKKISQFYQLPARPIDKNSMNYFAIGHDVQKQVSSYTSTTFGITIDENKYLFVRTPKHVYVTSPQFRSIHSVMAYDRVGVSILKGGGPHDRRPEHAFGLIFGAQGTQKIVSLTNEQIQRYVEQQDILMDGLDNGYYILQREGYGIGVGKIVDGVMKNKFVKGA